MKPPFARNREAMRKPARLVLGVLGLAAMAAAVLVLLTFMGSGSTQEITPEQEATIADLYPQLRQAPHLIAMGGALVVTIVAAWRIRRQDDQR